MSSSLGFPDWQKITQWLGAPLVTGTALALGAGVHDDGPYELSSWASVVVAIKPTGGPVTVTVKQGVSGAPLSLELDQSFTIPDGGIGFQSVVLVGSAVSLHLQGAVAGTTVDYALVPSNTTTQASSLGGSAVQIPTVALAAFPPASPIDGQAVLLVLPAAYDPIGGKAIRWLCTYDSSINMWHVAGPPLTAQVLTLEGHPGGAGTWQNLATDGPSMPVPRPGDYNPEGVATASHPTAGSGTIAAVSLEVGNVNGAAPYSQTESKAAQAVAQFEQHKAVKELVTVGAGGIVKHRYYSTNTGGGLVSFQDRVLRLFPLRIA